MFGQPHGDKHRDRTTNGGPIDNGAVTPNNAGFFQGLDTAQAGRRRQADLLRETRVAQPSVLLQGLQYLFVYPIH